MTSRPNGNRETMIVDAAMVERMNETATAICDSYAEENQQFHDRIEKLEAALREIINRADPKFSDAAAMARAALTGTGSNP